MTSLAIVYHGNDQSIILASQLITTHWICPPVNMFHSCKKQQQIKKKRCSSCSITQMHVSNLPC